jgi:signal transduction histidine kinase
MAWQIGLMIVALLTISAAALWGINGLTQDYGAALSGNEELRWVYEVGSRVTTARTLLNLERPDARGAMREIQTAAATLSLNLDKAKAQPIRSSLMDAQSSLWPRITADVPAGAETLAALNRSLVQISNLATSIRQSIQSKQEAADTKRRTTLMAMGGLSAIVMLLAIGVGIAQYRSVSRPLRKLEEGARRLAERRLDQRVQLTGEAEFVAVAQAFNRMADELDTLYRELEQKVAAKSRELVRSERLASVGYLAAGVAHEINNPIGIIAGYAEFALAELAKAQTTQSADETRKALSIIVEESFRCKRIVEKLLELARPGDEKRLVISLAGVAESVVVMLRGLGEHNQRQLRFAAREGELNILANEGEIRQVVLNLALNALAATKKKGGNVWVEVSRKDDRVRLSVRDDGKGMMPEVLERVFEPFFTERRGTGEPGTGLGLSITHAIVESHGGSIRAYSDGPGKGSEFVVEIPAAKP